MGFESLPGRRLEPGLNREKVDPRQTPWERIARLTRNRSRMIDEDVLARTKKAHPDYNFEVLKPKIERLEHGNLDINFVGVSHTVETLAAHRQAIESAIAEADIVVLEGSVNTSGAAVTSGHAYETSFPVHGTMQSTVVRMPTYELDTNSGMAFFSEMENMARTHGKQIVTFDPLSDQRLLQSMVAVRLGSGMSHGTRLEQLNQQIRRYSEAAGTLGQVVGYGALAGATVDTLWQGAASPNLREKRGAPSPEEVRQTRRQFLKRGAGYISGAGLGIGIIEKADANKKVIDFQSIPEQEKVTQYNETDFRDVSIAAGLNRLSEKFTKKMKVAVVYGAYHENGVREYLENPRLRQAKLALYKPFRDIAPPEMNAYKYELDPEIVSGKRKPEYVPEAEWGYWKQTAQVSLY